ncbi:amino acid ABC transporter permease [Halomarina litorea]|uniref:amino acid ABC transporter permease n=1 Tax=Halomarina litorea TaxID=2961595 RepID=UPI0020C29D4D|nr:amino acid ABC transporter permease [Halomarina sp. BCD28]
MAGERSTARRTYDRVAVASPSGRAVALAAGVLFWAWLVVRWVANWLGYTTPFFPAGPFEALAESLHDDARIIDATGGALAGLADFVAGFWFWFSDVARIAALAVQHLPTLASGAWTTVVLTVAGILFGLPIAIALSVARVYGGRGARALSLGYIELLRGTPLLAQLFVLYFGLNLSQYFRDISGGVLPAAAVWVAIVGFTVNSAAYQAEYIRSALESVEAGQLTAARAIGLSRLEGIRYVVLPQGLRYAIPGWTNELVYLIKYSSLAAFITVTELFFEADTVANETFRYVDMYAVVALFYLALVLSATGFMGWVEDRVAIPGLSVRGGR